MVTDFAQPAVEAENLERELSFHCIFDRSVGHLSEWLLGYRLGGFNRVNFCKRRRAHDTPPWLVAEGTHPGDVFVSFQLAQTTL